MSQWEMLECEECGAPASVAYSTPAHGVDFDGADALFEIQRVNCAAGHWYTRTVTVATMENGGEHGSIQAGNG